MDYSRYIAVSTCGSFCRFLNPEKLAQYDHLSQKVAFVYFQNSYCHELIIVTKYLQIHGIIRCIYSICFVKFKVKVKHRPVHVIVDGEDILGRQCPLRKKV